MKWKPPTAAILLLAMPLTSCAPSGHAGIEYCANAKPILIGKSDALTDETARQILDHDQTGVRLCGWE